MKNIKKFFLIGTIALIMMALAITVAAEDHTHTWVLYESNDVVDLYCEGCNMHMLIPSDTPVCSHEFTDYCSELSHGDECINCGYIVSSPHTLLEVGFVDGFHVIDCTGCDFTEYHYITEWTDEVGHHLECDVCGKTDFYEHTFEDVGFIDGFHVLECTQCTTTQDHPIKEWASEQGHEIECLDCGASVTNPHEFVLERLNDNFHTYTCTDCGYIECKAHEIVDGLCECDTFVSDTCTHESSYHAQTSDKYHTSTCTNCNYVVEEEHDWFVTSTDKTCKICKYRITYTDVVGLITDCYMEEDSWYITLLTDNEFKDYPIAFDAIEFIGDFVEVSIQSNDNTIYAVSLEVRHNIVNDIEDYNKYLLMPFHSRYKYWSAEDLTIDYLWKWDNSEGVSLYFKNEDKSISIYTNKVYVYNMIDRCPDEIEEGDKIIYNKYDDDTLVILIIG